MKRIHFFEFLDLNWLPKPIRKTHIEYLDFITEDLGIYNPSINILKELLDAIKLNNLHVVCSGTGRFAHYCLNQMSNPNIDIIISDLYPSKEHFDKLTQESNGRIKGIDTPIDALNIPKEIKGVRVITNALHHFKPQQVQQFFLNSVSNHEPLFSVEISERKFTSILLYIISLPFFWAAFLFKSRKKPGLLRRLFFGLLIPLAFLTVLFDGIVSFLRSYTLDELELIAKNADHSGLYKWNKIELTKSMMLNSVKLKSFLFYGYPEAYNDK